MLSKAKMATVTIRNDDDPISGQPLKHRSADNRSKHNQRATAQNTIETQQRTAAQYIAMKLMMKETADNR